MGVTEWLVVWDKGLLNQICICTSDMRWKHVEATCVIFQSFGHEEKCAHVVDTSHIRKAVENERRARLTAAFATKVPNLFGDESKFTKTNPPSNDGTGKQ